MKTAEEWLEEYGQSHQNPINKRIHKVAIPLITFSLLGILWCVPLPFSIPFVNLATIFYLVCLIFYARLSIKHLLRMGLFVTPMLIVVYFLSTGEQLLSLSVGIFIVSWIFQFIGHKIEGKKPSFFKDLQFLLIGPLWTLHQLLDSQKE